MPKSAVKAPFLAGVIEGFYGRPWSHNARIAYAQYLKCAGLNTYIYAPKADSYLRKQWAVDWPAAQWAEIKLLGQAYEERGLFWGVGLSPFELYRDYGPAQAEQLRSKLGRLCELDMPLLAVLFDDMPGDIDGLAQRQAEIIHNVCDWAPHLRVLVCPTYYSFDPVLEKHFGPRPADYWPVLGGSLPTHVDVFWTGNQVCSDAVTKVDLQRASAELGRPLVLWDNYPVNDGAVRSRYVYTASLSNRDVAGCAQLHGHLCNPMNQAFLSMPALVGLASLHGDGQFSESSMSEFIGGQCWRQLQINAQEFQITGLDGLSPARKEALIATYSALPGAAAAEVVAWLQGAYVFDPACLTD